MVKRKTVKVRPRRQGRAAPKRKSSASTKKGRTAKRWAPLPRSKAKTAWERLDEVCSVILAEPLRYDQELGLVLGVRHIRNFMAANEKSLKGRQLDA